MHSAQLEIDEFVDQFSYFPGTRYMGSKNKIIHDIWDIIGKYEFNSFFDAFAGSNVVSYFLKTKGKRVITNDFMAISHITSKAIIENSKIRLSDSDIDFLLNNDNSENYISKTFKGLYFSDLENSFLDRIRFNISLLDDEYKQALSLASLVRACMKKGQGAFLHSSVIVMTMVVRTSENHLKNILLKTLLLSTKQFLIIGCDVRHITV